MSVRIASGSILDFEGDAIVNPANSFLRHGAGLAKIIADAAAPEKARFADPPIGPAVRQWWADHKTAPLIATGNAHAMSAGILPYRAIIHAVGPIWNGGHFCEQALLRSVHDEALAVAESLNCTRVAFPAISCGLFGFPVELAAPIALQTAREWPDTEVTFYPFGFEAEFNRALEASS